jgi:osmotically-inducible protein OsmY
MNSLARSIVGAALTAAAVYLLDPVSGQRRRVLLQDRARRAARRFDLGTRDVRRSAAERYFSSRSKGSRGNASDHQPMRQMPDRAVNKMVFRAVRNSVSHPESVDIAVERGHVFLRGKLMGHEHQRLLDEVRRQPGVFVVTDHLSEHHGNGEFALEHGRLFRSARGRGAWGTTGRVLGACAGGALLFWGIRERKALGDFGMAIAEEFQRAMERNLRDGMDEAKDTAESAGEGLSDAAQRAGKKVEEGVEWAESASADVIEEYAQQRRRPNVADATH